MASYRKISTYLPITFENGNRIRRFAKHCVNCQQLVSGEDMTGVAVHMQGRVVIAAEADCPNCHATFSVACVVTDDKKVHRIIIPMRILRWWLSNSQDDAPSSNVPTSDRTDPRPSSLSNIHPSLQLPEWGPLPTEISVPSLYSRELTHSEETIGQYQNKHIYAWVELDGLRYQFVRALPPEMRSAGLKIGEVLVDDCIVYINRDPLPFSD